MAALTDKQKVIYNFIKSKPGYLKKSAANIPVKGTIRDIKIALAKAKEFFKKKPIKVSKTFKSLPLSPKQILKAKNELFAKMTLIQKRVSIAKDVIEQINTKRFIANKGSYFNAHFSKDFAGKPIQEVLCSVESKSNCVVCAMGAIFASKIRIGNNSVLNTDYGIINESDSYKIIRNLDGIFDNKQLRYIEYAFEGTQYGSGVSFTEKEKEKALIFYHFYNNADRRMIGIMKNIIKNKGTFIP